MFTELGLSLEVFTFISIMLLLFFFVCLFFFAFFQEVLLELSVGPSMGAALGPHHYTSFPFACRGPRRCTIVCVYAHTFTCVSIQLFSDIKIIILPDLI